MEKKKGKWDHLNPPQAPGVEVIATFAVKGVLVRRIPQPEVALVAHTAEEAIALYKRRAIAHPGMEKVEITGVRRVLPPPLGGKGEA